MIYHSTDREPNCIFDICPLDSNMLSSDKKCHRLSINILNRPGLSLVLKPASQSCTGLWLFYTIIQIKRILIGAGNPIKRIVIGAENPIGIGCDRFSDFPERLKHMPLIEPKRSEFKPWKEVRQWAALMSYYRNKDENGCNMSLKCAR